MSTPLSTHIVWLKLDPCDPSTSRDEDSCLPRGISEVFGRTLRIALAMRGGISLAVWIGGAVAELDVFRRIRLVRVGGEVRAYIAYTPTPEPGREADEEALYRRADVYARMLLARGYDTIEFDILAGASAGGLNGVLYAVAQRAGANVDSMLDVWLRAGDIWTLLRRPGFSGVDSVLRGDEYFWRQMQRELHALYTKAGRNQLHVSRRVTLDLSATITDGIDDDDGDSREGYGHFHFVGTDEVESVRGGEYATLVTGREIPLEGDSGDDPNIVRLAYAARTTSAFPGAFEPALISSYEITHPSDLATDFADLSFAFAAHRAHAKPAFHVVDGGVKDNIPIDRAFRSIRRAPFDDFATRTLLYLDPSAVPAASVVLPTEGIEAPRAEPIAEAEVRYRRADPLSRFLGATITSLKKFALRESGEQEIQAVEDFRRGLLAAEARSRVAAQSMSSRGNVFTRRAAAAATAAYVRARATSDVIVLDDILQHPAQWQLGTNLPSRTVLTSARENVRHLLEERILDLYGRSVPVDPSLLVAIARGPQALQDTVRAAAAWLRFLEEATFHVSPKIPLKFSPQFAEIRRLIDLAAREVRAVREAHIRELLGAVPVEAQGISDEDQKLTDDSVAGALCEGWARQPPAAAAVWDGNLNSAVIALRTMTSRLRWVVGARRPIDASIWSKSPLKSGFGVFDLAPFVSASGIPEPLSDLKFRSITSTERQGRGTDFSGLRDQREILRARTAMRRPVNRTSRNDVLGAESKLGGIALFNFGGFLSREWRLKDWWWGRLDAAAGMLRFLGGLEQVPLPAVSSTGLAANVRRRVAQTGEDTEALVDRVQEELIQAVDRSQAKAAGGTQRPGGFAASIPTLRDLRADYLSAVASRLIRVLSRALVRPGKGAGPARHIVVWLVRPIVVMAPLVFNLPRAFLAATLIVAVIFALVPGDAVLTSFTIPPMPGWCEVVFGVFVIAIVGLAWISTLSTFITSVVRWREVRSTVDGVKARDKAIRLRRRARARFWVEFLTGTIVIVAVVLLNIVLPRVGSREGWPRLSPVEFWLALLFAVVALGAAKRQATALPDSVASKGIVAVQILLGVGVLVAAELLFRVFEVGSEPLPELELLLVVGCAGASLAFALFYGWKTGLAPRPPTPPSRSTHVVSSGLATVGLSLACGAIPAAVAFALSRLLPSEPAATVVAVGVTYFVWGTTAWWAGEVPTRYEPRDDLARARS